MYHKQPKNKIPVTDRILKLTPIYASMINHKFAEFNEILLHLGKTPRSPVAYNESEDS